MDGRLAEWSGMDCTGELTASAAVMIEAGKQQL